MSLFLHLSARSEELLAMLRPKLAAARAASLAGCAGIPPPVPVLVASAQLGDWLQVRLARDLGLSMGFEFLQPRAYFGRHLADSAEAGDFSDGRDFWAPERLRWRILPQVDAIAQNLGHDPSHVLGPRDRFAFADLLARQFDLYARFRPDWPEKWDNDQSVWTSKPPSSALADEDWQRQLWRTLGASDGGCPHPARLLARLAEAKPQEEATPRPLFIVGTDLVEPLLLRTVDILSRRGLEVYLFLLLPSLGYLGDISRRDRWRTHLAAESPDLKAGGHPLLASLGQQSVGTFLLLESVAPDYAAWPDDTTTGNAVEPQLLQRIQADIRLQQAPPGRPQMAEQADSRPEVSPDDRSLRVHCCHSQRRELEVLRDELFRVFAEIPGLKPEDVLIAVTDFDAYAPLAEGVLKSGSNPLPVRLTAISAREANPIAAALLALLRLSLGRHTASELIELLNLAAIQYRLEVTGEPEVISHLADAIRQSGLTHGLDGADRSAGDPTGTLRAALDRQLAGSWFGPASEARDADGNLVHPIAGDLHHNDNAIGRLVAWLTNLTAHLHTWTKHAPAPTWAERLGEAIDDLLTSENLDDHAAAVRRMLGELTEVKATTELDSGTLADWLHEKLGNATSLRTSMGGEILLGRMDQIHGLPCRVLAILGLQDGIFPRVARRPAWDLLIHDPKRWDGDPRAQDRQWFLDCLLAPTDRLILTAANRSLRTPHDGPLSSCVDELLRVAEDTVRPSAHHDALTSQIVVQHRIQPFSQDYFSPESHLPRSFDTGAARIAEELAASKGESARPFFTAPGDAQESTRDEIITVTIDQLSSFWREPAKAWLRALQIDVGEEDLDDTSLDSAPVSLDALQAYTVRGAVLETRLPSASPAETADIVSQRMAADRALPLEPWGI